jgi:hypothetical protein
MTLSDYLIWFVISLGLGLGLVGIVYAMVGGLLKDFDDD